MRAYWLLKTARTTSPAGEEVIQDAGYISLQPMVGTREYTQFRLLDATRAAPSAPDPRYTQAMADYSIAVRQAHPPAPTSTVLTVEEATRELSNHCGWSQARHRHSG